MNDVHEERIEIKKIPILIVMVFGSFIAILNQTLINIALPEIMNHMNLSTNIAQWLITGFILVNGILIPVTAFLVERFTTRQLYLTSMSLFALGTLLCAIAPNFIFLLVGRIIQAVGTGVIMPLLMNVVLHIFPIEKRGRAMGVIGLAITFAPAIGPTLSGWIVQEYSWRVLFYIVLPIAILDIILAVFLLKNVTKQTFPKVDVLGIMLSTLGFGGLLLGLSSAGNGGWLTLKVILPLLIGSLSLIWFISRQLHQTSPMLEFRIFQYSMFSLTTIINVIITMAMFAGMILVPIYVQHIRGFTPLESGLLLLPGAILMGLMSPVTGWIFDKFGARALSVVGLSITTITTWELSNLTLHTPYSLLLLIYTARMFGMSLLMMPIVTAGLNQLPRRLYSHGTAMSNTFKQISGALGTAFLVTVMEMQTQRHMVELANSPENHDVSMKLLENEAAILGINDAFFVAACLSAIALVLSFFIKQVTAEEESRSVNEKG